MKKIILTIMSLIICTGLSTPTVNAAQTKKMIWPVKGEVAVKFHDPAFVFSSFFTHSGIDIAVEQGTKIKAVKNGIVSVAKKPKNNNYSYIVIVSKKAVATVYGHLSELKVKKNQKIKRGDVIALSGGQPGTKGAGVYTTGAHLHFEVRKNGIPKNPIKFLKKK